MHANHMAGVSQASFLTKQNQFWQSPLSASDRVGPTGDQRSKPVQPAELALLPDATASFGHEI